MLASLEIEVRFRESIFLEFLPPNTLPTHVKKTTNPIIFFNFKERFLTLYFSSSLSFGNPDCYFFIIHFKFKAIIVAINDFFMNYCLTFVAFAIGIFFSLQNNPFFHICFAKSNTCSSTIKNFQRAPITFFW